jgi:DNA repair protein RadC
MSAARLGETRPHDRPRERLRALGPGALTAVELLAILLGTGTSNRDAAVAEDLLGRGRVVRLARQPVGSLGVRGWQREGGPVAAALSSRRAAARWRREIGSSAARRTFTGCVAWRWDLTVEEFRLLVLDTQHQSRQQLITRGLLIAHSIQEVFRGHHEAAAGIVVLHNHRVGTRAIG